MNLIKSYIRSYCMMGSPMAMRSRDIHHFHGLAYLNQAWTRSHRIYSYNSWCASSNGTSKSNLSNDYSSNSSTCDTKPKAITESRAWIFFFTSGATSITINSISIITLLNSGVKVTISTLILACDRASI